jgi:hypothetical protein
MTFDVFLFACVCVSLFGIQTRAFVYCENQKEKDRKENVIFLTSFSWFPNDWKRMERNNFEFFSCVFTGTKLIKDTIGADS